MTESQIRQIIIKRYCPNNQEARVGSYKVLVPNVYLYSWESDLLGISRSNYVTEYEIKTSKQDYKNDFTKERKHQYFRKLYNVSLLPNRLYYVCPYGVIEEVPEYAGLIYICKQKNRIGYYLKTVKKAPLLHNEKFEDWENIAKKLFYKTI